MKHYELDMILSMLEYTNKQNWEQIRFLSYITAQSQSTKKLQPSDIIKFSWDEATSKENKNTYISTEDIERLKQKANKIIQDKQLNK